MILDKNSFENALKRDKDQLRNSQHKLDNPKAALYGPSNGDNPYQSIQQANQSAGGSREKRLQARKNTPGNGSEASFSMVDQMKPKARGITPALNQDPVFVDARNSALSGADMVGVGLRGAQQKEKVVPLDRNMPQKAPINVPLSPPQPMQRQKGGSPFREKPIQQHQNQPKAYAQTSQNNRQMAEYVNSQMQQTSLQERNDLSGTFEREDFGGKNQNIPPNRTKQEDFVQKYDSVEPQNRSQVHIRDDNNVQGRQQIRDEQPAGPSSSERGPNNGFKPIQIGGGSSLKRNEPGAPVVQEYPRLNPSRLSQEHVQIQGDPVFLQGRREEHRTRPQDPNPLLLSPPRQPTKLQMKTEQVRRDAAERQSQNMLQRQQMQPAQNSSGNPYSNNMQQPQQPQQVHSQNHSQVVASYQQIVQQPSQNYQQQPPPMIPQSQTQVHPLQQHNQINDSLQQQNRHQKIQQNGFSFLEEKQLGSQKNSGILDEWKQQIEMKKAKERAEKEKERQQELRDLEKARNYNPYGRAGGGAPNRDYSPDAKNNSSFKQQTPNPQQVKFQEPIPQHSANPQQMVQNSQPNNPPSIVNNAPNQGSIQEIYAQNDNYHPQIQSGASQNFQSQQNDQLANLSSQPPVMPVVTNNLNSSMNNASHNQQNGGGPRIHMQALNQNQFSIGQEAQERENRAEDNRRKLQMDLAQQMEEVQRKKEEAVRKKKEEEAREEEKLKKEREELEQAYKREKEAKQRKIGAVSLANEELMISKQQKNQRAKAANESSHNVTEDQSDSMITVAVPKGNQSRRNQDKDHLKTDDGLVSDSMNHDAILQGQHQANHHATGFDAMQRSGQLGHQQSMLPQSHDNSYAVSSNGFTSQMQPNQFQGPNFQPQPSAPQIDQQRIITDISSALQNNFKEELGKLKSQMDVQQEQFARQLQDLQHETAQALDRKREAEQELQRVKHEVSGDPNNLNIPKHSHLPTASFGQNSQNQQEFGSSSAGISSGRFGPQHLDQASSQQALQSYRNSDQNYNNQHHQYQNEEINQPTQFDSSRGMPNHIDSKMQRNNTNKVDHSRQQPTSGLVTFQNSAGQNSQRTSKELQQMVTAGSGGGNQHSTVTLGPNQSGSGFKTGTFLDPSSQQITRGSRPESSASMKKQMQRQDSRSQLRKNHINNYEKMFFNNQNGQGQGQGQHPKDNQYVTFQQENQAGSTLNQNGDYRATTKPHNTYDHPQQNRNSTPANENQLRYQSSNLKGDSSFVHMGVTPQEDELAIIENLTKNLIQGSEGRKVTHGGADNYNRNELTEGGMSDDRADFGTFGSYNFSNDANQSRIQNMQGTPGGNNVENYAERLESKYGKFDFPVVPEDSTLGQSELRSVAKPPRKVSGRPPRIQSSSKNGPTTTSKYSSNHMLNQVDPTATTHSAVSVTSANLERINQLNIDRLAKLENAADLDDSKLMTLNSTTNVLSPSPNAKIERDMQQTLQQMNRAQTISRQNSQSFGASGIEMAMKPEGEKGRNEVEQASQYVSTKIEERKHKELAELDDMLADILAKDS